MKNKQAKLPENQRGGLVELTTDSVANARYYQDLTSTQFTITLNPLTTLLEIQSLNDNVFMAYGNIAVTSTNFDEFIQMNDTRHYVVPDGITQISFSTASATKLIVIEK